MTSLITSQRHVRVGWIQEMDTYSAYMSKSQYMQSYWFSNKSNINIIYNISVVTITITMSVILANFGKYAISDCPFICLFVCLCVCGCLCLSRCLSGRFNYEGLVPHKQYFAGTLLGMSSCASYVSCTHDVIDEVTRSQSRSNFEIDISPSIFE